MYAFAASAAVARGARASYRATVPAAGAALAASLAAGRSTYYTAISVGEIIMPTNFKSDNVTAACPEVMEALLRANADEAANSYGGTIGGTTDEPDPSTLAMNELFAQTFECEVDVFPVARTACTMI